MTNASRIVCIYGKNRLTTNYMGEFTQKSNDNNNAFGKIITFLIWLQRKYCKKTVRGKENIPLAWQTHLRTLSYWKKSQEQDAVLNNGGNDISS